MGLTKKVFGILDDGREALLYELTNAQGMRVTATNYGGAITSIQVPDRSGALRDVALGFDSFASYRATIFGVAVGRVANRIGGGRFSLDGIEYQLDKNDHGRHHLHGGAQGFNRKLWDVQEAGETSLLFTLHSPHGEGGYPGNLDVRMTYTLSDDNAFRIGYRTETDTKTICNLSNHSFFNLEGHDAKDIYGHEMQINGAYVTAVGEGQIPTGERKDVSGTAYDFRLAKPIGRDIAATGAGYDDNYVLDGPGIAARVYAPGSGIIMTVRTDSPGLQFFTGNFLDGTLQGKGGVHYHRHGGFCLETQIFPDAINHPDFPSCIVEKGKPQNFFTEYIFSAR